VAKTEKRNLEGWQSRRYENQKAAAAKDTPWGVFRVIAAGQHALANFCALASIFRNPVTGNPFRG